MAPCPSSCQTVTHWGGFVSFLVSYCCLLACAWVFVDVLLLLTHVAHCHFVFLCCLLEWLCVFLGVLPPLPEVGVNHFRYTTVSPWGEFASFQLSHCRSLGWLHFILVSQWCLLRWFCMISDVSQLLTVVELNHFRLPTNACWGACVKSQMFHYQSVGLIPVILSAQCHFLMWLYVVPLVPLLLSGVAPCHSKFPSATYSVGFMLYYVFLLFNDCSLGRLCVISGVLEQTTGVFIHHLSCSTSAYWCSSVSFHLYHWSHSRCFVLLHVSHCFSLD